MALLAKGDLGTESIIRGDNQIAWGLDIGNILALQLIVSTLQVLDCNLISSKPFRPATAATDIKKVAIELE